VLTTIELLKQQAPTVGIALSHTISPSTMEDSLRCYELSRELGLQFVYRLAHEAPYLRNVGMPIWNADALRAVQPIVEELNRRMLADQTILARASNINYTRIAFYGQIMDYAQAPRRMFDCYSGTHSFLIAHNGDVQPCVNLPVTMGNVRQQPFDEIWFSERTEEVRKPIAEWKCHCFTNCETELSLSRQKSAFLSGLGQNARSLVAPATTATTGR
jgi:radical SAM protein with 4Fe4S-binding SPASM domain